MELATIRFNYTSLKGKKTRRTIDVEAFGIDGIEGHCHLRGKWRPFKFRSMEECIDIETGEFIPKPFLYLANKLKHYKCKNSIEELDKFLFLEHDFFLILVYIGRQSGQLRKRKKEVIVDACCELHGNSEFHSCNFMTIHDLGFLGNGFSFFNTKEEFEEAVSNIAKHNDKRRQILINAAEKIIKIVTNGAVKEKEVLQYISVAFT